MFSSPLVLQIPSSMQMINEQFFDFCQMNRDLRIERNKSYKWSESGYCCAVEGATLADG